MDITPHVNLLKSLRGERVDYRLLIGEGIDNSFDAGASRIDIHIDHERISFQDNGVGIVRERLPSLFSLGEHGALSTTQLGRFGVGIKTQAVNSGDVFAVLSTSRDGRFSTQVNWPQLLQSGRWQISDPVWIPSAVGEHTGTIITISKLRSRPKDSIEKLAIDIAQRFYPAVADGKEIFLNRSTIGLLSEPEMTDIVDVQLSLSGSRGAHLRAGILVGQSPLNRVHVAYKHRVIMPASSVGCGEYGGGLNKMFARLRLTGPWHLARFKNDLPDEDERDELEDAVLKTLAPILEKCSSASFSAKLSDMAERVNDLVPDALAARRPKHLNPNKDKGTTKRPRRPGAVSPDKSDPNGPAGVYKQRPSREKLLITFDGMDAEVGIGTFRPGRPNRVELSKDNPFIAELMEHRDTKIASRSLVTIAFALFEQGRIGREPELPFEEFGQRIAKHLLLDNDETSSTMMQ